MAREKEKVLRATGNEPFRMKARRKARKLGKNLQEEEEFTDSLFGEEDDGKKKKKEKTGFEASGFQDALLGE